MGRPPFYLCVSCDEERFGFVADSRYSQNGVFSGRKCKTSLRYNISVAISGRRRFFNAMKSLVPAQVQLRRGGSLKMVRRLLIDTLNTNILDWQQGLAGSIRWIYCFRPYYWIAKSCVARRTQEDVNGHPPFNATVAERYNFTKGIILKRCWYLLYPAWWEPLGKLKQLIFARGYL